LGLGFDLRFFWTIVVLITAISFGGFVLVKYVGSKTLSLASFFGGFVSSLAVVAVAAGKAKKKGWGVQAVLASSSAGSIASDAILLSIISLPLLTQTLPTITAFFLAFATTGWFYSRKIKASAFEQAKHPLSLKFITEFSVAFFLVNWILTWASRNAPDQIVLTSLAGGILSSTSVFASIAFLSNSGLIGIKTAVLSLFAAISASLAAKTFVASIATGKWTENLKTSALILVVGAVGVAANLLFKIA